jgi:hypothetical protein
MSNKDYSGTRKNVSKTMLGNLAETLGFKKGLSYKQLMTEAASLSQKSVRQGLKRAGWRGALALGFLEAVGYGGAKLIEKTRNTPTTKSTTKTYAEMVKEDKEKGKSKVLSRRAPDAPPRKPKDLIDKMAKEGTLEKARPRKTTKQEKKTPKKLFMKEGKTNKDSKVEFKATTGNTGLLASKKDLKPVPVGKKGKGLSMLDKSVRNNMGFMYGGGMPMPSKKPRMSTTDYRKASKGMLIISIDMKKKKPKTKKNKRG